MASIYIIACASKKLPHKAKASDIYISALFKKSLHYARGQMPDNIFIISAKHGLLALDDEIDPYDMTLDKMPKQARCDWGKRVIGQLSKVTDSKNDKFVFLAGAKYREHLISSFENYEIPLAGLKIGEQLKWLKEKHHA